MYDLGGKVALVTGASRRRGLGASIARGLAREGADVAVSDIYIPPEQFDAWDRYVGWRGLESLVEEIQALGRRGLTIHADLTKSKEITGMVARALEEFGKIDILVNNAGIIARDTGAPDIVNMTEEIWNRTVAVNLTAPFLICKAVVPQMIRRGEGGRIINMLSAAAKRPTQGRADYCATKFGLNGLTEVLALELGKYKITANGICPGFVVSWGSRGALIWQYIQEEGLSEEEAIEKAYAGLYAGRGKIPPLARPATTDEVVNLVLWLASPQAEYFTGQALNFDGGETMH
ncbi:MAG: SDR family NAD(P)-dependent oxidoreductase [Chloroflexota bacterium]